MDMQKKNDDKLSMKVVHANKLKLIRDEAQSMAGALTTIANVINETLDKGGVVNIQAQLNFITGAHARITKDYGVVEYLQQMQGVSVKPHRK